MIRVKIDASQILTASEKLPVVIRDKFGDALDHISLKFLKKIKNERLSGSGDSLKGRPGGIFKRFKRTFLVPSSNQTMGVEIFSASKIALLHEEGGTMQSDAGKKLAIPISAAASKTELTSGAVKKQFGGTSYIRDVKASSSGKRLRAIKSGGKIFLFAKTKDGEKAPPLFVLQTQVRIKPRLGFYKTWESMEQEATQIVDSALNKASKEVWG